MYLYDDELSKLHHFDFLRTQSANRTHTTDFTEDNYRGFTVLYEKLPMVLAEPAWTLGT